MIQRSPSDPSPPSSVKPGGAKPALQAKPAGSAQVLRAKAVTTQAVAADAEPEEDEMEYESGGGFADFMGDHIGWLTSMVVHTAVFVILALIMLEKEPRKLPVVLTSPPETAEEPEVPPEEEKVIPDDLEQNEENDKVKNPEATPDKEPDTAPEDSEENIESGAESASEELVDDISDDFAFDTDVNVKLGKGPGEGRDGTGTGDTGKGPGSGGRGNRRSGAIGRGATLQSEKAVNAALEWLAKHQLPDGSWNFDHGQGACQGRCGNPGTQVESRNGATGLALLPFLGAGHTHLVGDYKMTVARGLRYLMLTLKKGRNQNIGTWYEKGGTNYSHGLATIAMCEAYAMAVEWEKGPKRPKVSLSEMTEEQKRKFLAERRKNKKAKPLIATIRLKQAAQLSINYIMDIQDKQGGGWRYTKGPTAGDTSVVGWMLMALKSAHGTSLALDRRTVIGASHFLDTVSGDNYGSKYFYLAKKERSSHATTAIGILCRMYLGAGRHDPRITTGANVLAGWGPTVGAGSTADMYYNYYATQVMFHIYDLKAPQWKAWNKKMRDTLVGSQATEGHEKGSWYLTGDHGTGAGGRLYSTAMAAMTLEVYYRHMPLYKKGAIDKDLNQLGPKKGGKKGPAKKAPAKKTVPKKAPVKK